MGFFSQILAKALFKLGGLDKKLVEDKEITGYLKQASKHQDKFNDIIGRIIRNDWCRLFRYQIQKKSI